MMHPSPFTVYHISPFVCGYDGIKFCLIIVHYFKDIQTEQTIYCTTTVVPFICICIKTSPFAVITGV